LFDARLELIAALDGRSKEALAGAVSEAAATYGEPRTDEDVRRAAAELLQREVAAMKLDNFLVRPHRRLVERYAKPEAWVALASDALVELSHEVAGLPTEVDPENEEAKRFDLLALKLQLSLLHSGSGFERLRDRVKDIAGLLAEKDAIPMVREQMALIQEVMTDEWWHDVTVPMLESMRRRLRGLVQLIDKRQRKPVYTDFEDETGAETGFALPGVAVGTDPARFIAKARAFLRQHLDPVAIAKLRMNRPLTSSDLSELERLLGESGVGEPEDIRRAAENAQGLGLLVRSLVGMDRAAAKQALVRFTNGKTLTANQLEFVSLIVDHLTEHGVVEAARLYESPFTDFAPHGPDALFKATEMDELLRTLLAVRANAVAA
jgi:type I restriction enzyme R subunit